MPLRLAKALGLLPLDRAVAMEDRERQNFRDREKMVRLEREREHSTEKIKRKNVCVLKWASEFIINK